MGLYPRDFTVPRDQGGPGQGQRVEGFGGNPNKDQAMHRATVQSVGKAPVILVHGNGGSADHPPWDMKKLQQMLMAPKPDYAPYPEDLIWAPSYLGRFGQFDNELPNPTPHANNVNEVREFIDNVCEYLDVNVVDVIAHSLGCSLAYSVFRGLSRQGTFDQPNRWSRVGTFVALAGAFKGLGSPSPPSNASGEWISKESGGVFMEELLKEYLGGGGETPYREGKPKTPPPAPHNITYFCAVAKGDSIDGKRPGTGKLAGAVNEHEPPYMLRGIAHQAIKESEKVFEDFRRYLNSVPPAPPVSVTVDKDSGGYAAPLAIPLRIIPSEKTVEYAANRLTKEYANLLIADEVSEELEGTLRDGQTLTLPTAGMWEVVFSAEGAVDDMMKTYWIDVKPIETTITTDNPTPFDSSLAVTAKTTAPTATLYHSLDGQMWDEGAAVTITEDKLVYFIAIDPDGIASEIASKSFKKRPAWEQEVTASANKHFLAGRIGVDEYLAYSQRFGFFTPFTLYLVDGQWMLDPNQPQERLLDAMPTHGHDSKMLAEPTTVTVSARDDAPPMIKVEDGDPQPGEYDSALTVAIEAADDKDEYVTVHYTRDGSIPGGDSPSFQDREKFKMSGGGSHIVACYARDSGGNETYRTFHYRTDR